MHSIEFMFIIMERNSEAKSTPGSSVIERLEPQHYE